jgi:retron-type reverse transcriptase
MMKKTIFEKLNQLNQRSMEFKKKPIDRNLYKLLSDVDMLQHAYENIKSRPGNLTPGVLDETLDGISKKTLEELSKKLVDESFQFRTARRTFIPKKSGQMRPITISPPRDKIVQESMRIILNAIYEPLFMEQSHGFRPGRGCHSALKQVNQKFQSTV